MKAITAARGRKKLLQGETTAAPEETFGTERHVHIERTKGFSLVNNMLLHFS